MGRAIAGTMIACLAAGCGGPGWLDGVDFEIRDAIYSTSPARENTRPVTTVVVSDAPDLCDPDAGDMLAGHRELSIRHWEGGSVEAALLHYDADCTVLDQERSVQGWGSLEAAGHGELGLDLVFRTEHRNVSGRINARWCDRPSAPTFGCE